MVNFIAFAEKIRNFNEKIPGQKFIQSLISFSLDGKSTSTFSLNARMGWILMAKISSCLRIVTSRVQLQLETGCMPNLPKR